VSGRGGKLRGPGWRSIEALRWLARLDVAGIEALGCALGFGRRATYSHLQRLADAGYVIRVFDPGGSVVAITAAGRRWIGTERGDVRAGATHGSGLRHARAVSWVAALLTVRERAWVSERELRGQSEWEIPVIWPAYRGRHRPDLGALMGSQRVAIEVELSLKAPRRLEAILCGHEQAITSGRIAGGVIYVCDRADVLTAVTRAAERAALPSQRFRLRRLVDVQAEVRGLTSRLPDANAIAPASRSGATVVRGHAAVAGARSMRRMVDAESAER
jgi:DNA-binding transcriptional ArsR family regulator